jgi:hypothetical protein
MVLQVDVFDAIENRGVERCVTPHSYRRDLSGRFLTKRPISSTPDYWSMMLAR